MSLGVDSEVGRLHKVMVHRPGLEHTRLTPSNAAELLFDDVLWVAQAEREHDAFCGAMRDRGVEVYEAEALLAEALGQPHAREWAACPHPQRTTGRRGRSRTGPRVGVRGAPCRGANFLIGGIARTDVERDLGLVLQSADPNALLLPPLPNFIFQRDPSCWIFDGVTLNPMTKPARKPESMIMETIYRFHPMFTAKGSPSGSAGRTRTGASATSKVVTSSRSATGPS